MKKIWTIWSVYIEAEEHFDSVEKLKRWKMEKVFD